MLFELEQAKEIQRQCLSILKGYASDVKLVPAGNKFRIIVLHHGDYLPELPPGVETDKIGEDLGNPQDSSNAGKFLDRPMSDTNRETFLPDEFQMGYRGIQDIVDKFAMNTEQIARIASVAKSLQKLAEDRHAEIDRLLETVRDALLHLDVSQRTLLWKLLLRVQSSYDVEAAQNLVTRMERAGITDGPLLAARKVVSILNGANAPTRVEPPKSVQKEKVVQQTVQFMLTTEKNLEQISSHLKYLGLEDAAEHMHSMISDLRNVWESVSKLA